MEHHPAPWEALTATGEEPAARPWQAGSLTGAVASQNVTEAPNGSLGPVGNRA